MRHFFLLVALLACANAFVSINETQGVLSGYCEINNTRIEFKATSDLLSVWFGNGTRLFTLENGDDRDFMFVIIDKLEFVNTSSAKIKNDFTRAAGLPETTILPACSFELGALGFLAVNDSLAAQFHLFALWVAQAVEAMGVEHETGDGPPLYLEGEGGAMGHNHARLRSVRWSLKRCCSSEMVAGGIHISDPLLL